MAIDRTFDDSTPLANYDPRVVVIDNNQQANNYASAVWDETQALIELLLEEAGTVSAALSSVVTDDSWGSITTPTVNINATPPDSPDLESTVDDLTVPTMDALETVTFGSVSIPTYNISDPVISFPEAPTYTYPDDPGDAPSMAEVDIPTNPTYELPTAPTLNDIALPTAPDISIPTLDAEAPEFDLVFPGTSFIYNEDTYQSDLLEEVKDKLLTDLQNVDETGGMSLDVEDAIWTRATTRYDEEAERALDMLDALYSGFDIPPASYAAGRAQIIAQNDRQRSELSYDITVKQAELAQTKALEMVKNVIGLEKELIAHSDNVAQRSLQSAIATVEMALKIHDGKVKSFLAELENYKTAAYVVTEKIKANMLELEVYKGKMEGAKIEADIQNLLVALYNARLGAVQTSISIYKTEMEGAAIKADVQKRLLEAYGQQVSAYVARINGITARYNAYQAQVAGEKIKADVYLAQTQAYGERVKATQAEVEINAKEAEVQLAQNQEKISKYEIDLKKYDVQVKAILEEIKVLAEAYGYESRAYESEINAEATISKAQIDLYRAQVDKMVAEAEIAIKGAEFDQEAILRSKELTIKAMETSAQITSQLTASVLNTVHTSASLSFSDSRSQSKSDSWTDQVYEDIT